MDATGRGRPMKTHPQWRAALAAIVLFTGLAGVAAAPLAAVEGGAAVRQAQAGDPQAGFVPAKDLPAQEQIPAAPLVMAAYAFVWAALLVYVWTVWRRLARVEREVHDLSARLASREGSRG